MKQTGSKRYRILRETTKYNKNLKEDRVLESSSMSMIRCLRYSHYYFRSCNIDKVFVGFTVKKKKKTPNESPKEGREDQKNTKKKKKKPRKILWSCSISAHYFRGRS